MSESSSTSFHPGASTVWRLYHVRNHVLLWNLAWYEQSISEGQGDIPASAVGATISEEAYKKTQVHLD